MKKKPHLILDSYKLGHIDQYPAGTQYVYSNLTARSAAHANLGELYDNKVVFFGLQGFIKEFLIEAWNDGFFNRPKEEVVAEYKRRTDAFLGPDSVRTDHIAALHDLGYLPLIIRALPEGSRVNIRVPFLTIENTLPEFYWLTNYIETVLSNEVWKPITTATIAYEYRRILDKYVEMTGASKEFANWQIHDFSMRGMSGWQDAAKSGAAHLVGTQGFGTDTLPAIDYLEEYYLADVTKELVAGSVPATEHSVMCMGGVDDEVGTFRRLITQTYPSGVVSIVSDTWDFWNVITNTARELKEEILARKENALGLAKVVFRPDSGDPLKIITGLTAYEIKSEVDLYSLDTLVAVRDGGFELIKFNAQYFEYDIDYTKWNSFFSEYGFQCIRLENEVPAHVAKGAVDCLWDIFGGDTNEKGYKTLNQRVGLIYGDSITVQRAEAILKRLADKGFSASNIVFGVGSYTYQYVTRDTFGMAVKATFGQVNGVGRELFKDPKTGDGVKKSAKGLIRVVKEGSDYVLYDQQSDRQMLHGDNDMRIVFMDGQALNGQSLNTIVSRLKQEK